jgi:hypothetical protein
MATAAGLALRSPPGEVDGALMARRPLALTMAVGRGLRLRIVERPGLSLPPPALAALLADLRQIADAVLTEGELDYGVLSGAPDRLANSVVTVVYDARSKTPVAFNALALMDVDLGGQAIEILHLGLVMVDPNHRGKGLSDLLYGLTCVLLFLRRQCRTLYLSNVTQVPSVFGMVAETFDQVFPRPGLEANPGFAHRSLARQILARHRHVFGVGSDAVFDENRSVIQNAYTGGSDDLKKTFSAAPKHRKGAYNDMCARELDYERGDDFLQIGQINMAAAARYISKLARPHSTPWLAAHLVLIAAQSTILPVIHWFADDQPWGSLRPWRHVRP